MSIFKVKQWWSNAKLQTVEPLEGTQNEGCMKVDKFNSHNDSDCILVGEGNRLKIYKPNVDQDASHTILETDLSDVVLQVETGKFVGNSGDREILILHPQSYVVYELYRKEGHTNAGEQNHIVPVIKHCFKRKAYSIICGPFGGSKARDLICIQSVDGTLSFFDQDTFLFMCIFNDILIPGPICYSVSSDVFAIYKSTWILEIFSYRQLREASELSLRQNKNTIPQWTYNAGEEISSVQVLRTSSHFSSIIFLGERHLYCFQDNGLMKYLLRFYYMPICFCAYLIGWYYEPGARILVMVASDESKLFIYEGTTMLWACDLTHNAISLSRCFLTSLPGGIVTLAANGIITVMYLGTEPDLNPNVNFLNEVIDPQQVQAELDSIDQSLEKLFNDEKGNAEDYSDIEKNIKIKLDVGKPAQKTLQHFIQVSDDMSNSLSCSIILTLTFEEPKQIQSIQINYTCSLSFAFSEQTKCLDDINGTEIIETYVSLNNEHDLSDTRMRVLFTIIDHQGKIVTLSRFVTVPFNLYCEPIDVTFVNQFKMNININQVCLDFKNIFPEFARDDLLNKDSNNITFSYRTTKNTVTLISYNQGYSVEANDFPEIAGVLDCFLYRLEEIYSRMDIGVQIIVKPTKEFIKQMLHKFLKNIEAHAKERVNLKKLKEELNVLQRQFTTIQKSLLVQYGSLPPGDCDPLEFLMRDTHERLIKNVQSITESKDIVYRTGSTVAAVGQLIICILKHINVDTVIVNLVEDMLYLESLHEDFLEWEEAVAQSLSFVSNKLFKKSEKDKEKLAPVTEQDILSQLNLKRFLKQLRVILEKILAVAYEDKMEAPGVKENVLRMEELVEII